MSKAEDRALEKYPIEMYEEVGWRCVDKNAHKRQYFIEGYHQAEEDNELTWEDISTIRQIMFDYDRTIKNEMTLQSNENYCKEVLKRFKELKK